MTSRFVDRAFGLDLTCRLPLTIVNSYLDLHTIPFIFFYLSCIRDCRTVTLHPTEVDLQFIDSFVDIFRLLLIPQRTMLAYTVIALLFFFYMNNNLEATPVFCVYLQ